MWAFIKITFFLYVIGWAVCVFFHVNHFPMLYCAAGAAVLALLGTVVFDDDLPGPIYNDN